MTRDWHYVGADHPTDDHEQADYARLHARSEVRKVVYEHLAVLDAKASALLRYNGIAIAVLVLIAIERRIGAGPEAGGLAASAEWWTSVSALALFFASTFLCLSVVGLYWYRLEDLRALERFEDAEARRRSYGEEGAPRISRRGGFERVNGRSRRYRMAYLASFAGTAPLLLSVMQAVTATGASAAG